MKTVIDLMKDVNESLVEMNEQLKDFSAKKLMIQRELEKIETEEKYVQENISLYRGILDDLNRRRSTEDDRVMKGNKEEPVEKKVNTREAGWQVKLLGKCVIALNEKGEKIAEYASQIEASNDTGIPKGSITRVLNSMSREKQLKKYGFVLKTA